jgi:hypothetical protein
MKLRSPGLRAIARRPVSRLTPLALASAGALVLTAVAAVAPGGPAAQAVSYGQPVITVADGNSVIAVQGSDNALLFYWNEFGTSTWHREVVAAAGSTFSTPSIVQDGNSVVIAAQGVNNSLDFYWQANGASSWHPEVVAGPRTTFSAPSIAQDGNSAVISAEGPSNSLRFYWAANGSSAWTPEVVAGTGTTFSDPSLAVNGKSVNIAAQGPGNSLRFYWAANGSSAWTPELVAGAGTTYSAPDLVAQGGGVDIAAWNNATSMEMFYWALNGTSTWHPEVTNGGVSKGTTVMTALPGNPGGVIIVGRTFFSALETTININGSGTWQQASFSLNGGAGSEPSVTDNAGSVNIAVTDYNRNLYFYWQDGSGQFNQEVVDTAS